MILRGPKQVKQLEATRFKDIHCYGNVFDSILHTSAALQMVVDFYGLEGIERGKPFDKQKAKKLRKQTEVEANLRMTGIESGLTAGTISELKVWDDLFDSEHSWWQVVSHACDGLDEGIWTFASAAPLRGISLGAVLCADLQKLHGCFIACCQRSSLLTIRLGMLGPINGAYWINHSQNVLAG